MSNQASCKLCQTQSLELDNSGVCPACIPEPPTLAPTPHLNPGSFDETVAPSEGQTPGQTESRLIPLSIGDYEIIEEIARGGMGVVYKARHTKLNRIAALKMVLGGRFSSSDELQRFQVEAESAAKLDHPGIVPVFDIGEQDGQPFFAMKYIEGGSLAESISRFRASQKGSAELISKVAAAVHHAHQRGILHRDLKPANILLDDASQPMITDLGLAKSTGGDSNLTHTGAVLGTPSYMAPEQASGEQSITTGADIFSIGAIFYELLTGRPPHKGATTIETVMSVISDTPVTPRKLNSQVDPELELICLKCIEKDPSHRYESAAALNEDLENWLAGNAISIKPPSLSLRVSQWFKRNKTLVYAFFALFIGLAFSFPVVSSIFGPGTDIGNVYDRMPNQARPIMFSFGKFPEWVSVASNLVLFLVIWPSIGLMNMLVTKPTSIWSAVRAGALTASVCAIIAMALLGWLIMTLGAGMISSTSVEVLANAVWLEEGETREVALKAANKLYDGLDQIPESERASVLTDLVISDQVGRAPKSAFLVLIIALALGLPVIYGTVIAYVLSKRQLRFWLVAVRYFLTWTFTTLGVMLTVPILSGGRNVDGVLLILMPTFCIIAWLSFRRWKKAVAV